MVRFKGLAKRLVCAWTILAFTFAGVTAETRPGVVDIVHATNAIEQALSQGVLSANQELMRLGPDVQQALQEAQDGTDFRYARFSAQSSIEMLYRRAEAHQAGQGERFLARLKSSLGANSAAIARDPRLSFLDNAAFEPQKPIVFASLTSMTDEVLSRSLSPAIAEAVTILSEHAASKGIAHIRGNFVRNLKLHPSGNAQEALRTFDKIVQNSKNTKQVVAAAVLAHVPPPKVEQALRNAILEFARTSGAFAVDPAVSKVLANLSTELTGVEARLTDVEKGFATVQIQKSEIARSAPGGTAPEEDVATMLSEIVKNAPPAATSVGDLPFPEWNPSQKGKLTQNHQNYVERSFERRAKSNVVQPSSVKPVSRKYRVAILSPRAARGIAVGADMEDGALRIPLKAYWVSDPASERFGRFVVSFSPCLEGWFTFIWRWLDQCNVDPVVAVSDRLHADSFLSAIQLLWGTHSSETKFAEGDITVLMSMDPSLVHEAIKSDLEKKARASLAVEAFRLRKQIYSKLNLPEGIDAKIVIGALPKEIADVLAQTSKIIRDAGIPESLLNEEFLMSIDQKIDARTKEVFHHAEIPRGIVFHPSVHGRELAWSAGRVDFWFNDTKRLFEEAGEIAGDMETAEKMRTALHQAIVGARTWQFYEEDATIDLDETGGTAMLVVRNSEKNSIAIPATSRFAVTLFQSKQLRSGPDDEAFEILDSATAKEPLAWLQNNHPDFWRLKDFSTSLMLLRFLKEHEIKLISLSLDDQIPHIPTPEWIFGGKVEPVIDPLMAK